MDNNDQNDSLYGILGENTGNTGPKPNPSTTLTASVETIDNDRASSDDTFFGVATD